MAFVIAMAGKGGTGKTTLAAMIVRFIKETRKGSVLAVDADPNSNLAEYLGAPVKETVGQILDDIARHPEKVPGSMPKDRFIEFRVQSAIAEGEGFDVLSMGRPEGPGCYCYVNNALRNVVATLLKNYDFVVIDNEAGLEHLSRRTTRSVDTLLVISDTTAVGLRSAQRINALASELEIKIKQRYLLLNRSESSFDVSRVKPDGIACIGTIPPDEQIMRMSIEGRNIFSLDVTTCSLLALKKIGDTIWGTN